MLDGWTESVMTLLYRLPPQWISVLAYLIPRVMYVVAIILRPSCSNPTHGKVYSIEFYIIKFVSDLRKVIVFSSDKLKHWSTVEASDITMSWHFQFKSSMTICFNVSFFWAFVSSTIKLTATIYLKYFWKWH
jgi:hypothetical protein